MKISELVKKVYFWSCGYSYTNLGRMFLRLFVGIMYASVWCASIGALR